MQYLEIKRMQTLQLFSFFSKAKAKSITDAQTDDFHIRGKVIKKNIIIHLHVH